MRLVIASTNPGKIREFRQMLATVRVGIECSDLTEYRQVPPVEETGHTFLANACLKAGAYARALGMWALADDSGLSVDALEGQPGVHSARWAAMHQAGQGDQANNLLLLRQLESVTEERRTGRFICALALADPAGRIVLTASDSVEGRILSHPRGVNGFGYDPLFLIESLGKTTAELPPEDKHQVSHRGKALRRLGALMQRVGIGETGLRGGLGAQALSKRDDPV